MNKLYFVSFLLLITSPSFAYVGPGFAGGAVTAVLGLFAAIFMLLFGIIWYPLKKLIKSFSQTKKSQ